MYWTRMPAFFINAYFPFRLSVVRLYSILGSGVPIGFGTASGDRLNSPRSLVKFRLALKSRFAASLPRAPRPNASPLLRNDDSLIGEAAVLGHTPTPLAATQVTWSARRSIPAPS